jgi:hypothetical protein
MDEEFHAVIGPHPPLPLPNMWDQNHLKIDPIGIDPIVYTIVRLDPVTVHITGIGLLSAEAPVDEYASMPTAQNALTAVCSPFKSQRRRGVNPNRLPISSNVAL